MQHDIKPVESWPAHSWYEATATRDTHQPLSGPATADVCVIGGGLAGLTTALACQHRGLKTILLEGSRIACAASGRNGGFVSNGFALGVESIIAKAGLDAAKALYALSREGTEFVRDTIIRNDPSLMMGLMMGKGWRMALRHRDNGGLKKYVDLLNTQFGEQVSYATAEETRQHLATSRYFESLHSESAFHIHPLKYGLLLAKLAINAGAAIHENSLALSCEKRARVSPSAPLRGASMPATSSIAYPRFHQNCTAHQAAPSCQSQPMLPSPNH